MIIDENLVFIALITIFAVFIIQKAPYLVGILILIILFYYLYKGRFTNPRDFYEYMINKTKETFEPCSVGGGTSAYCGPESSNSNLTFLPEIVRSSPSNDRRNNINNKTVVLQLQDYQIDKRLKMGIEQITADTAIAAVPPLIEHKLYLDKVINFVIGINTDDTIQKDFLARKLQNKMTKIFYNAYNTVTKKSYPINIYNELLYSEREFDDTLNIFVFLGMNDKDTDTLLNLQKEFKNLNNNLNEYVIEKVNDILPNDYDITTSFLPQKDEPKGVSVFDDYLNLKN